MLLFQTVRVSPFCSDLDKFLGICRSPRLAKHVRLIDWQEITYFTGYFERLAADAASERVCKHLEDIAKSQFWFYGMFYGYPGIDHEAYVRMREKAIQVNRVTINEAIQGLPRLEVILSMSMGRDRRVPCS
jgi:hypothetical protein